MPFNSSDGCSSRTGDEFLIMLPVIAFYFRTPFCISCMVKFKISLFVSHNLHITSQRSNCQFSLCITFIKVSVVSTQCL